MHWWIFGLYSITTLDKPLYLLTDHVTFAQIYMYVCTKYILENDY